MQLETHDDNVSNTHSTNFESLKTVAKQIQFCGSTDCGIYPSTEFPYIALDLPSLEETDYLEVAGTVKRFGYFKH